MKVHVLEVAHTAVTDPNFYVGAAAFIAAVAIPFLTQRRGKLFFDVVCAVKMFDKEGENPSDEEEEEEEEEQRRGLFDPREPMLIILDLENRVGRFFGGLGGQDIDPDQYKRPISINFGENANVLDAVVWEQHPPEIQAEIDSTSSRNNKLVIKPVLLNQGDWLRLKAEVQTPLEKHPERNITATGRILGVRKIQERRSASTFYRYGGVISALGAIPYLIFFLPSQLAHPITEAPSNAYWAQEIIPRSVIFGFSTTASIAFFLLTFMALVKYCRKWIVVRQFKHLTPESWVPDVLLAIGPILMIVGVGMGVYTLASFFNLAIPYWLYLLATFVLGAISPIWLRPLVKLKSSLEERISQKRRRLRATSKHTP